MAWKTKLGIVLTSIVLSTTFAQDRQYTFNDVTVDVDFNDNLYGFTVDVVGDKHVRYIVDSNIETLELGYGVKMTSYEFPKIYFLEVNGKSVEDPEIIKLAEQKLLKYNESLSIDYLRSELDALKNERKETLKDILDEF